MSNCISIRDAQVRFPAMVIDIPALKAFLESLSKDDTDSKRVIDSGNQELADRYIAAWFLWKNTTIESDSVVIRFGAGMSSHTNRDFAQTINLLNRRFILANYMHVFRIADEWDDFRTFCGRTVIFDKGAVQQKLGL